MVTGGALRCNGVCREQACGEGVCDAGLVNAPGCDGDSDHDAGGSGDGDVDLGCGAPLAVPGLIRTQVASGINRSITVVLGRQISKVLQQFFTTVEILLVLSAIHALLGALSPSRLDSRGQLGASWGVVKALVQSLLVQLIASYLTASSDLQVVLFNLLLFLVVADCAPGAGPASNCDDETDVPADAPTYMSAMLGEDRAMFLTTVSYVFSDELSALLTNSGVPLVSASLGLFFNGQGLLGQTLVLTGVNALCSLFFGVVGGGELSIAWPIVLLYFANEVVGQFEGLQSFVDYGLYKVSESLFSGLVKLGIGVDAVAPLFFFLGLAPYLLDFSFLFVLRPVCVVGVGVGVVRRFDSWAVAWVSGDQLWLGLCVLVVVRALTDLFLDSVGLALHCDPIVGGLCILAAIQAVTWAVDAVAGVSVG